MWLLNSSIGKKLIMSISGLFLILFLVFHLCMNIAAVFSGEAYNVICGLLGSNDNEHIRSLPCFVLIVPPVDERGCRFLRRGL